MKDSATRHVQRDIPSEAHKHRTTIQQNRYICAAKRAPDKYKYLNTFVSMRSAVFLQRKCTEQSDSNDRCSDEPQSQSFSLATHRMSAHVTLSSSVYCDVLKKRPLQVRGTRSTNSDMLVSNEQVCQRKFSPQKSMSNFVGIFK